MNQMVTIKRLHFHAAAPFRGSLLCGEEGASSSTLVRPSVVLSVSRNPYLLRWSSFPLALCSPSRQHAGSGGSRPCRRRCAQLH